MINQAKENARKRKSKHVDKFSKDNYDSDSSDDDSEDSETDSD